MGLVTTDISAAAAALAAGRLCAIPTETVYGLAADASNPAAVASVFEAKGRPSDHPLIVHVADLPALWHWIDTIPDWAVQLAKAAMPGPLTLVGLRTPAASDAVTGGQATVAVRVPQHPMAQTLLRTLQGLGVAGLVAPSANTFGHVSPTTAAHVAHDLGGYLSAHEGLILDGGPCTIGVESTIVLATGPRPVVLRPGAVTRDMIADATGLMTDAPRPDAPRVSGTLESHYAPHAQVHLHSPTSFARQVNLSGGLIATDDVQDRPGLTRVAAPGDADALAHDLYAGLRQADELGLPHVHVVVPDGDSGVVEALRDRVSRAAASEEAAGE